VELRADPDDGRARRLFLTEDGRAITRELYRIGDGMIAEMTRHWSSHDLATLTALMQRLTAEARTFARDLETSGEDEA
jgi:DNA-binding MarR family transcriptional regulator